MNFEAVIIGCITGFLSAFFGIGGSSVDTPVLRVFLNLPHLISLGTPLPLTVLTATIASFAYNGGGIFFVPAYVILFRMKIKEAIATSLLTVIAMAIPGSIIHYNLGHIDPTITTSMAIGVIPMAYLGAKLDIRTSSKTLMILYGIVMVIFSVYFFISQLKT